MEAATLPAPAGLDFEEDTSDSDILGNRDEEMGPWALLQYMDKYSWKDEDEEPIEVWPDTAYRVVRHVLGALNYTDKDPEFQALVKMIVQRKFIPGGRYLASSGRTIHQTNNCFLFRCEDSREGWADLVHKAIMSLSSGGGIGSVYSDVRPYGTLIQKTGGFATGPLSPAKMVNEIARHVMQGGHRRSAIWAGLHWNHKDIFKWIEAKDWSPEIVTAKEAAVAQGGEAPAPLDMTNISVILDDDFFAAFDDVSHEQHMLAQDVYYKTCEHMVATGEPGFSIDVGDNVKENLRNACTEITSEDDSDVCNLGSINMARIESREEFAEVVRLATLFLIAGTVYSDVPYEKVKEIRAKNRRLGLGLMGLHEWLLVRGYRYEMVDELREWLDEYALSTSIAAKWADKHKLSHPVKTRAIAPNGTIGIIGETTTSAEPIFCVAYKRRFLDSTDGKWKYQYVIDPTAHRLIESGVNPDDVEDAYALSYNVERRIKFQADLQEYVDHGIASTINLPYPITDPHEAYDFAQTLYQYLPRLRGVTCYPNGARAGQPLEGVPYEAALGQTGVTFEEDAARTAQCRSGACGV
jgi:ribonucleoside-diphosphate reductase alpha chain